MEAIQCIAPQEQWHYDDDDDDEQLPLLLSHHPAQGKNDTKHPADQAAAPADFEFRVSACGALLPSHDMCAADEVFLNGQMLPLRPSVSSGPSRCGSQSNSTDRSSCATTSRSSSSSSNCVSRSQSSNSSRSSAHSNNFYTHPSPRPQLLHVRRTSAARRSAGSAPPGWGIFRLGLIRAPPQIELYDARTRQSGGGRRQRSDAEVANGASKRFDGGGDEGKVEKKAPWQVGRGFGCGRSPDAAVEPSAKVVAEKERKKKNEGVEGLRRADSICRSRIFEWLEELSISKSGGGGGGGGR